MRITIAERLRPYSHVAGTHCVLPGSSYGASIYPCFIRLYSLLSPTNSVKIDYTLDLKGPVKEFTVLNDLEKGRILVWGHSRQGFFRYYLMTHLSDNTLVIHVEKAPSEGIKVSSSSSFFKYTIEKEKVEGNETICMAGEEIRIEADPTTLFSPSSLERLSLGSHKAQDFDLIRRRLDLTEILPIWNRLGELVPLVNSSTKEKTGTASLLDKCQAALLTHQPDAVLEPFNHLFQAGFQGILVPRLYDDQHQGIVEKLSTSSSLSPLVLLTEGRQLIRRLFIEEEGFNQINILPYLPPQFHCGRFIGIQVKGGTLDLEWSKKTIRQMIFRPNQDGDFLFQLKPSVQTFRLRENKKSKGQKCQKGKTLFLQKNNYYFFDNFS